MDVALYMDFKPLLIRNTASNMGGRLVTLAITFFLTPFLLNRLTLEEYGLMVLTVSFSVMGGSLALLDLGFQGAMEKYVAEYHACNDRARLNQLTSSAFFSYLGLGLTAAALLWTAGAFLAARLFHIEGYLMPKVHTLFALLAVQVLLEFCSVPFLAVLEGMQRFDLSRYAVVMAQVSAAVVTVVLVWFQPSVVMVGWANLLGSSLLFAIVTGMTFWIVPGISLSPMNISWEQLYKVGKVGLALYGFRVTGIAQAQADRYIVPSVLDVATLTYYSVAIKLHGLVNAFAGVISGVIMPTASVLNAREDTIRLRQLFLTGTRYSAIVTLPLSVSAVVLAEPLLRFWLGSDYAGLAGLSQVAILPSFFSSVTSVGFSMMVGMGKIAAILKINLVSTLMKIVLSVAFAYLFGLPGLIWSTVVTVILVSPLYLAVYLRALNVSWFSLWKESVLKPLIAAVVLGAFLVLVQKIRTPGNLLETLVIGAIGVTFYALSLPGVFMFANLKRRH